MAIVTVGGAALLLPLASWAQPTYPLNGTPSRVVGTSRITLQSTAPNLPEGREFYWPAAIAIDNSVTPSALYVADSRNNRVLVWRNAASLSGAPADLVLGQRDRVTTSPKGPGTDLEAGFSNPSSLALDATGNLYVGDAGNNRVLRFPRPLAQDPEFLAPDMVIGQRNFRENQPNQGNVIAENTLRSRDSGSGLALGLAFDAAGNLWVADPLNHRVIRFPQAALAANRNNPAADIALGVNSLIGQSISPTQLYQPGAGLRKDFLFQPTGVAVDRRGRILVRDWMAAGSRVVVYDIDQPLTTGRDASRLVGLPPQEPNFPRINDTTLNGIDIGNTSVPRPGVATLNGFVYVPDAFNNRIMVFDPVETWPAETTQRFSPQARTVIGQNTFLTGRTNRGLNEPSNAGFNYPVALAITQSELFVADMQNNRVMVMPGTSGNHNNASRVLGQDRFDQGAPNLVEGKEFYFWDAFLESRIPFTTATNNIAGTCLAIEGNRIYVADPGNHRVLAFSDLRRLNAGLSADFVIGQPDLAQTQPNWPNGDVDSPSNIGLNQPTCVAVDPDGNLWVADSGNGRVVRFPKPFDQPPTARRTANLVLGQLSFTSKNTDPTSRTMRHPAGIAFLSSGSVLVSDLLHHRVLRFRKPQGGDLSNGQAADAVFGQSSFTESARRVARELNRLSNPKGLAVDSSDRVYVTELTTPTGVAGGDRLVVFSEGNSASLTTNPSARQPIDGLTGPQSVWVNKDTGQIWIANSLSNTVLVVPRFEEIFGATITPEQGVALFLPMAIAVDSNGAMLVADGFQRLAYFFPRATAVNAAGNSNRQSIAPGMYVSLFGPSGIFGTATRVFTEEPNPLPMPKTVGDLRVFFNETPAPIHFISPGQINALVPKDLSLAQTAEITVVRASTGQVLAAARAVAENVSPGFFTATGTGSGQVAALNEDNTVNSASNAATRGTVITLFGTGAGLIPGEPADGAAPTAATPTPETPRVNINGRFVQESDILYSGLAPGLISVWQINVRIPDTVPPNNNVPIAVVYRDTAAQTGLRIAVK